MLSIETPGESPQQAAEPPPDVFEVKFTGKLRLNPEDREDAEVIRRLRVGEWLTFEAICDEQTRSFKPRRDGTPVVTKSWQVTTWRVRLYSTYPTD